MKKLLQKLMLILVGISINTNQPVNAIPLKEFSTVTKGLGITTGISIVGTLAFAKIEYNKLCKQYKAQNKQLPTFIDFCKNNTTIHKLLLVNGALMLVTGVQANAERMAYTKEHAQKLNLADKINANELKTKQLQEELKTADAQRAQQIKEQLATQAKEHEQLIEERKVKEAQIITERQIQENQLIRDAANLANEAKLNVLINTPSLALREYDTSVETIKNAKAIYDQEMAAYKKAENAGNMSTVYGMLQDETKGLHKLTQSFNVHNQAFIKMSKIVALSLKNYGGDNKEKIHNYAETLTRETETLGKALKHVESYGDNAVDTNFRLIEKATKKLEQMKLEITALAPTIFDLPSQK